MADADLADVFARQARHFDELGAPVYAVLARRLAEDPAPVAALMDGRDMWDGALRLFGAVHDLVLAGAAPDALSGEWGDFVRALGMHADGLRARVRDQAVQTNEVRRCTALLPAFLELARRSRLPLELLELGPSAGLNLLVDRYRYWYAAGTWGPDGAPLELAVEERGEVPAQLLTAPLTVRSRRGIDLAPVDATSEDGYRLLRSFLWPGRADRVERLDRAIAALRTLPDPPELLQGDYVELLPAVLADRPGDALTVVFQAASTGYLSPEDYRRVRSALDVAGADGRPLAWVSTRRQDERTHDRDDRYELEVRLWPGPPQLVAYLDFHGNWIDWLGGATRLPRDVRRALENDGTIDITTRGARSGVPRRCEIWFLRVDERTFLTGTPGRRHWYANLLADEHFMFHLKESLRIDLDARAVPVRDAVTRHWVFTRRHPWLEWYRSQASVAELVEHSPLVEVHFTGVVA
jgi:hypothetical protein